MPRYGLSEADLGRLRELASIFLDEKVISGARFEPTDYQCVVIAAVACLLILELDLDWFDGWVEIIVYPEAFLVDREEMDESGVVHQHCAELDGESWERGPIVLSWADFEHDLAEHAGYNLVLHEFAHKLDSLNGSADGFPPIHRSMDRNAWANTMQAAYENLGKALDRALENGEPTPIDPYAAESPGEFFAVVTEAFFEVPDRIMAFDADVYHQFSLFYRQDPLARIRNRG